MTDSTIVLVHGAFAGASGFAGVIRELGVTFFDTAEVYGPCTNQRGAAREGVRGPARRPQP